MLLIVFVAMGDDDNITAAVSKICKDIGYSTKFQKQNTRRMMALVYTACVCLNRNMIKEFL